MSWTRWPKAAFILAAAVAVGFLVGWLWPEAEPSPREFRFEPSYYPDPEKIKRQEALDRANTL